MRFLLTNDDGIYAPGLAAIKAELEKIGQVTVIAPITEQSAVGHSITIADPLRVQEIRRGGEFYGYGLSGSPADCVKLGISCLMTEAPDVVVSGINRGENVGVNVLYSGTVSAATEALVLGYKALALSVNSYMKPNYQTAAGFGARLAERLAGIAGALPFALNVNCPSLEPEAVKGVKLTHQGQSRFVDSFVKREDPRGNVYYWQAGLTQILDDDPLTDAVCLRDGYISVTPIDFRLGVNGGAYREDLEGLLSGL
ncbi:MAG: 5'/3'-nucleotidase SurE [Deltaproteobacteria bacterium ADurb.Bin510]|nr:MAG: 5'/3'-nucleotidase SurE [Deltaproteobacteria bacterium ADurb.Bin510]